MVDRLIADAYALRASDIHLEPFPGELRIRFRIDGVLQPVKSPPRGLQSAIISRLKLMAGMLIDVKRLPQDGRIRSIVAGKPLDLRVSCLPTTHGETIVMRLLDKEGVGIDLGDLGLMNDDRQTLEEIISLPDGMVLVTGPTGSGKTTTLYSVLKTINKDSCKVITVEDPIEYLLSGINQVQVNAATGMTFSSALRTILRQAPNIILIGEIRDSETANIAMNAALTGHLVFSTLHTNDAPSAVTRLIDMGVKPFLIASAARAMVAQRLVRRICPKCSEPFQPPQREMEKLGITQDQALAANIQHGKGCPVCHKSGYHGRVAIYEMFVLDEGVQRLIYEKASADILRTHARAQGMRSLREDGLRKVFAGITTPIEVLSATLHDAV
jgi:type IV pilus assembly protein PilB